MMIYFYWVIQWKNIIKELWTKYYKMNLAHLELC